MVKRRDKTVEISASIDCPCGSGKKYGRCCKRPNFRWEQYPDGTLAKSLRLPSEAIDILKAQDVEFLEIFGRKPRKNDPVFFQQFYISESDQERLTLKTMKAAASPPPVVYAYRKTGRIVTTENKGMLTPGELKEWNDAIDEYYETIEAGEQIDVFEEGDGLTNFLKDTLRKNQIVGGSFIDRHFNNYRKQKSAVAEVEAVVAFATTNFVRCLKSVYILIDENVSFDAYPLVRAMYENYLTTKFIYNNPDASEIFSAQLGILIGTHKLAESGKGVPKQSEIFEIKTGKRVHIPSRWSMASSLGQMDVDLYHSLYRTLSSYTHSEITTVRHFISERGYDYQRKDFTFDVLANCHLLCLLFFSCIAQHSPCLKYLKGDLSINAERSLFSLSMIKETLAEDEGRFPGVYDRIIAELVASDSRLTRLAEVIAESAATRRS